MVKNNFKKIVFFVFFVFFVNFISATSSFGVPNHSIQTVYSLGDEIHGWVNLSLLNESSDSSLSSSLGSSISLLQLIKVLPGFKYTCVPEDCNSSYEASDKEASKEFSSSESSKEVLFGLYIKKEKAITEVSKFLMNLKFENPESEGSPLIIDFFDDNISDWVAYNGTGYFSDDNPGCFEEDDSSELAEFSGNTYCEKITLSPSPGVIIGANVIGTGDASFKLSIQGEEGENCDAESRGEKRVFCELENFEVKEKGEYSVCIQADNEVAQSYKIKYEEESPCGFNEEGEYDYDFDIFAQEETYGYVGAIVLNTTEIEKSTGFNIEEEIENYLFTKYKNNCSKGCVIPIKFIMIPNSKLSLTNLAFSYSAGIGVSDSLIYNLAKSAPKLSTNFSKLMLDDANFSLPSTKGNYTFSLSLGSKKIFTEKISVETGALIRLISSSYLPKNYSSTFTIKVLGTADSIDHYNWDFGDQSNIQKTSTPTISYAYLNAGNYTLTVEAVNTNGKVSSGSFPVQVVLASAIVPSLLTTKNDSLNSLKNSLKNSSFTPFQKESITSTLKLNQFQSTINKIASNLTVSTTESEFSKFLANLSSMDFPNSVLDTLNGVNMELYPSVDVILPSVMGEIEDLENYSSSQESAYREAITTWWSENKKITFSFDEFSSIQGSQSSILLKTFTLNIEPLKSDSVESYLVTKKLNNLILSDNSSVIEKNSYLFIPIDNSAKTISLSTSEDITFSSLPVFISPVLSKLSISTSDDDPVSPQFNKQFFIGASIIVVFIGLISWILIGRWYRTKYEAKLFKDKNQLYNLVNFIQKEKDTGKKKGDIVSSLKKAGWSSEQLRYAMKKHANKSTGMPGISTVPKEQK